MAATLTSAQRSLRARIGAHSLHASHDPQKITAPARAAFLARFEEQVDPEHLLPEGERKRRAEHARKAHFTRLALASSKARREASAAALREESADAA